MPVASVGGPLVAALLALLVCVQYGYVLKAAVTARALAPSGASFPRLACVGSAKGGKPVGSRRDCGASQGSECTLAAPCTPCAPGGDCQKCSASVSGACGFIEGRGPYCRFTSPRGEAYVAACTKCCS